MDKRKALNSIRDCVAESSLTVADWELIMLVAAKVALSALSHPDCRKFTDQERRNFEHIKSVVSSIEIYQSRALIGEKSNDE